MNNIKKHIALPLLVITLAFIILIQNYIRSSAVNSTFYLEDLYGSREHLKDVTISGNLQDGYHNNIFEIINGNLEFKTIYYLHYKDLIPSKIYQPSFFKIINNVEYELRMFLEGNKIIANIKYYDRNYEKTGRPYYGEAIVKTSITSEQYTGNSLTIATSYPYVITNIGERIFFTIPTTKGYSGTNGIFEVLSFSDKLNYLLYTTISQEETNPTQNSQQDSQQNNKQNNKQDASIIDQVNLNQEAYIRTVAEFSIDVDNQTDESYIEVLGLQAVNNYLVLILRQSSSLIFRSYDSESGEQTGEVIIKDSSPYLERYEVFTANNILNLCFRKNVPGDERRILTFEITGENRINDNKNKINETGQKRYYEDDRVIMRGNLKLTNIIDEIYADSEIDRIFNIFHKDNKVYVVLSLIDSEANKIIPYDVLRPRRMLVYVYEDSKPVYIGEIVTDMNQDNIFQLYGPATRGGIPYNTYERRLFEDIQIRSKN